jgi:hypothetical protein
MEKVSGNRAKARRSAIVPRAETRADGWWHNSTGQRCSLTPIKPPDSGVRKAVPPYQKACEGRARGTA